MEVRKKRLSLLTPDEQEELAYIWEFWARPNQLPPDNWTNWWILLAGRGFGKTRTGAEATKTAVCEWGYKYPLLIAPTAGDARDIMIEGESGLLAVFPDRIKPTYEPSKKRVVFHNGVIATIRSADEPERLRGVQSDFVWGDELAAWRYLKDAWDMMEFGHRLGENPIGVVTTTPKPLKLVKELIADKDNVITGGSTFENRTNLSPKFLKRIKDKYEGTRLGRQELYAQILDDLEGALWSRSTLEELRVREHPELVRIVIAIDPAVTSGENADETGIIVAGTDARGKAYILEDLTCRESPDTWARIAVSAYYRYQADRIVAEVNQGGDMVELTLRTIDRNVSYTAVRASKGKRTRAEPVAALYEQKKVYHVGALPALEDQMCEFAPDEMDYSPDRVDALVWVLTELMLGQHNQPMISRL